MNIIFFILIIFFTASLIYPVDNQGDEIKNKVHYININAYKYFPKWNYMPIHSINEFIDNLINERYEKQNKKKFNRYLEIIQLLKINNYEFLNNNKYDNQIKNWIFTDSSDDSNIKNLYCIFDDKTVRIFPDDKCYGLGQVKSINENQFLVIYDLCGPLIVEKYDITGKMFYKIVQEGHAHAKGIISNLNNLMIVFDFDSFYDDFKILKKNGFLYTKYSSSTLKLFELDTGKFIRMINLPFLLEDTYGSYELFGIDNNEKYIFLVDSFGKVIYFQL
jgi:hypothetical protein